MRASEQALQILGGYGYLKDYATERYYRDAKQLTIVEGTSEIHRLIISRALDDGLLDWGYDVEAAGGLPDAECGARVRNAEWGLWRARNRGHGVCGRGLPFSVRCHLVAGAQWNLVVPRSTGGGHAAAQTGEIAAGARALRWGAAGA